MDLRVPAGTTAEELAAVLAVLSRPGPAAAEDATAAWRRTRLAARRATADDAVDAPHPGRRPRG